MIRLVCGYRQTGKDYLFRSFGNPKLFNWQVYANPLNLKPWSIERVKKVAFARNLIMEVNMKYYYPLNKIIHQNLNYEQLKNTIIINDKTYRDLLIEHAKYRRDQNIDYWVSSAYNWKMNENLMVTDWRYINELTYLKKLNKNITTIRVFRSKVPIPQQNIESEHQLDNILTDFLLVPEKNEEEEFIKASNIFPQYKHFIKLSSAYKLKNIPQNGC